MRDFRFGQIDTNAAVLIVFYLHLQTNIMDYKKLFRNNFEKLLTLPMDDSTFIAKLTTNKLLPGDTGGKIEAQSTLADKASYFLNHIIKPSLDVGIVDSLNRLLSVMEQCDYDHIKQLALEIKSAIEGMHMVMHIIWLLISSMCVYIMCMSV